VERFGGIEMVIVTDAVRKPERKRERNCPKLAFQNAFKNLKFF